MPIFRYKTVKNAKKTAVKRRDCANFPKRAIDIDCPHFGPDTPGHAAIGPTNYLKTFPVAPENVRICPCIWTLTVKNRPKNGQDADRCCDVAWVLTGAPTMLGCLVWVPASCACPKRQLACGPHLDSDRVSGVIELIAAADFKMNLIMKDFEKQLLRHHSGLVHLKAGTTTSSGSSRRRLQSACRHFSFRQPCLPTSVPPVCPYWT